jgi:hypothetical protein
VESIAQTRVFCDLNLKYGINWWLLLGEKTSSFLKTQMVPWPAAMDQLQVAQNHSKSILRTHSHHFHMGMGQYL